jgi:hypothetical protein
MGWEIEGLKREGLERERLESGEGGFEGIILCFA